MLHERDSKLNEEVGFFGEQSFFLRGALALTCPEDLEWWKV